MRTEPVLAGLYDPLRRIPAEAGERRLRAGLAAFGDVTVHRLGPLTVGVAAVPGAAPVPATSPVCLVGGYLEAEEGPAAPILAERWAREGAAGFLPLRGAFAGVVWDAEHERGVLVRDHLAQRPLFLLEADPVLAFATEVRPLLALPERRPEPDPVALVVYLSPSELHPGSVPYRGVERVPGGAVVHLADGRWRTERFWRPRYQEPLEGSPEELAEVTRAELRSAVRRTTGSARDVGLLLSGGLDSTSVAASAAPVLRDRGGELHAYSQVFPDFPTADESEEIAMVTEHLHLPLTALEVHGGSSLASSLEYLDRFQVPEFSATGFFWRPLARRADADGMAVLLSGEGGDEVFGTAEYLIADRIRAGHLRDALALVERFPNIAYNPWRSLRARLLWRFGVLPNIPLRLHAKVAARNARGEQARYLSDHAVALLPGIDDPRPWREHGGPIWWNVKVEHFARRLWQMGAPEQTTRAARLAGVTERHPLLTLDLVEHALRLPPERGFDPDRTRPDQRRAMAGLLPDPVRLRPEKVDFDAIRGQSLLTDHAAIRELLADPQARIRPYVRAEVVEAILRTVPDRWGTLSHWGGELMRLVTAEAFLRQAEDPGFAGSLLASGRLAEPRMRFLD